MLRLRSKSFVFFGECSTIGVSNCRILRMALFSGCRFSRSAQPSKRAQVQVDAELRKSRPRQDNLSFRLHLLPSHVQFSPAHAIESPEAQATFRP